MDNQRGERHGRAQGGDRKVSIRYKYPPPHTETRKAERRDGTDPQFESQDEEGEEGDLPDYTPTPEDLRIKEVYGDWVNANAGNHLHGGIKDKGGRQGQRRDILVMPSCRYDALSGKVGRRFIRTFNNNMRGVRDIRWKSEWFIVFQIVILKLVRHITVSHAIRRRIEKRFNAWEDGRYGMLVDETLRSNSPPPAGRSLRSIGLRLNIDW